MTLLIERYMVLSVYRSSPLIHTVYKYRLIQGGTFILMLVVSNTC